MMERSTLEEKPSNGLAERVAKRIFNNYVKYFGYEWTVYICTCVHVNPDDEFETQVCSELHKLGSELYKGMLH